MNDSGIFPMEYNVLVKPKVVEERTKGGVYLPDENKEREQFAQTEGTLVAVSPGAFTFNYEGFPSDAPRPAVGQRVMFSKYQATETKGQDGETYWLMKDKAVAAVLA